MSRSRQYVGVSSRDGLGNVGAIGEILDSRLNKENTTGNAGAFFDTN